MMPNMDPRTMRNLMAKMGIKSYEVNADRVIIETSDKNIIIENPQVTRIEAQGAVSFQVSGDVSEAEKNVQVTVTDEDVELVSQKTGITDTELIRTKLAEANGDIAKAILDLTENTEKSED